MSQLPHGSASPRPLILPIFVQAHSKSQTLSLLDYGTNYCNLYNLMDGSGLVLDPEFTEDTNDRICTQRSTADCDIY